MFLRVVREIKLCTLETEQSARAQPVRREEVMYIANVKMAVALFSFLGKSQREMNGSSGYFLAEDVIGTRVR